MTKDEDFKLLKIQTCILKVNIHCDGCKQEVKKLLQRIEGVYSVSIDAEHQKVTVSGNVDPATLIKRLARSGKHAELWSQKLSNQNHKPNNQQKQQHHQQLQQAANIIKDGNKNNKDQAKQGLVQGLKAFRHQHSNLASNSSDDDDYCEDDEDDVDNDDLRFLSEKMNQINLLRQAGNAAAAANAAKKNHIPGGNGNSGGAKKVGATPNQNNHGMKNPNGPEQKVPNFAANGKMGNFAHLGGGNPSAGEVKRMNDFNGMTGLGFQGLGGSNGIQAPSFPGFTGLPANGAGFGGGYQQQQHQSPMMMNNMPGYQAHPASMMMNMRGHNNNMMMHDSRYIQPQMMYHRSPQISPYTGYYQYPNSYPSPYRNHQPEASDYGTHLFSDENTNGCVIM